MPRSLPLSLKAELGNLTPDFLEDCVRAIVGICHCQLSDAEDALSQAILEALERIEIVQNLRNLLITIAIRRYYDTLRKTSRQCLATSDELAIYPSDEQIEQQFLGEEGREILWRLAKGEYMREVAQDLGLSFYRVKKIRDNWAKS